jgi:predicted transcriptional regulator
MATELSLRDGLYGLEYREPDGRRVDPTERKTYDIKAFWQRHHEIVSLAAQGWKQTDIADILHIHPQTVSNTLNSEIGKEKLAELREVRDGDTKKRLEQIRVLTEKALGVYHEIFDNETGEATIRDRKEVADTVLLDLAGMRSPTKIQSATISMSLEDLNAFKERGKAAMRESGIVVVDVEADEVTTH